MRTTVRGSIKRTRAKGTERMLDAGNSAGLLRAELAARNRVYARGRNAVESYGSEPVVVYAPEDGRHGNFFDAAYAAIEAKAEWARRFNKVHAQAARSLPKAERRWRELDSSTSSDALLMNVFCTPGVCASAAVRGLVGAEADGEPEFGWKARVPLKSGRLDRTEVDMRWGDLLVEAKLTETDFQTCRAEVVGAYRDFDAVFEVDELPRVAIAVARQQTEEEFPEEYTQEEVRVRAETWERPRVLVPRRTVEGFAGYQLIRNVLAAEATGASFCVVHDERRPDLREMWFGVMRAVRGAELRTRLRVLTWQELAAVLPEELQVFLDAKYGIVAPGVWPTTVG